MSLSSESVPTPTAIFETLGAFRKTAILKSAIELGVFTAIAEGALTASAIASVCPASERGMRILCDNLVLYGFLTKSGDIYQNTLNSSVFLNRHSPAYMGGIADFLCNDTMVVETIRDFTACVRRGGTMMPGEGTVSDENPMWVEFARTMGPMMRPAAEAIAQQVPASGPLKVLDVAAGHGLFGISIAQRNPEAHIVALDWAGVLEVAKQNAAEAGVADRYSTLPGSAFEVNPGIGYDLVLITNFLHHFSPEVNEAFLRRAHAALKPGAMAITLEFVPDESRTSPPVPANFAMIMLSTTTHGDAFTFSELDLMFRNAGFSSNTCHRIPTEQSIIISVKSL